MPSFSPSLQLRKIGHKIEMATDAEANDPIARAASARKGSPFLNTAQAAHYLGLSPRRLEEMREEGSGPTYRKHGSAVRYHIKDLDAWSETSKRSSTRQPRPPEKGA